jgi:DNA-binding HxlR family transcriptional regulator
MFLNLAELTTCYLQVQIYIKLLVICKLLKIYLLLDMAKTKRRSDCPINFALELFGDRWTFLIVRDLMFKGKHYYKEFLEAEEGIATNILADKLSALEEAGIVSKTVDPTHRSKQIYKLTKKGIDLVPVLVEVILWSSKHDSDTATDIKFVRRAKKNKVEMIDEIMMKLKDEL